MGTQATRSVLRLVLDHHYSPVIAQELRSLGHEVVAVIEQGWEAEDDLSLFHLCSRRGAALLTNNVGDFTMLARTWAAEGRSHSGLIFTSDSSMPRNRSTIGRYIHALDSLLRSNTHAAAFDDRVHWL